MVQCESAKVVLFEWSHPRISSTDLKVRMTTDLGITSSRHERVKESPFALLLPPVLWEAGLQNLLFLFLLPPFLWVTGYGIFFPLPPTLCLDCFNSLTTGGPSKLFDAWWCHLRRLISYIYFFCNGRSRLCFMKHFSRSLESSWERRSHVARDITMPRTVWMVRLWYDIYSGNTDTHVPKKKHYPAVCGNFSSPNFCIFTIFP